MTLSLRLNARISKEGKRVLCGNRQCCHIGLASLSGRGVLRGWYLAQDIDRWSDGSYRATRRAFRRTAQAFKAREAARPWTDLLHRGPKSRRALCIGGSNLTLIAQQDPIERQQRSKRVRKELFRLRIEPAWFANGAIEIQCPRCQNVSVITPQLLLMFPKSESR